MDYQKNDMSEIIYSKSPLELVILNYESIVFNLHRSKTSLEENSGDYTEHLDKARAFLALLMSSLDMRYDISQDLMSLYIYINKLIINARIKADKNMICDACDMISSLMDSWKLLENTVRKQEPDAAEYKVAGFEYKGGKLCEVTLNTENREITV